MHAIGKSAQSKPPAQPPKCPECASQKVWKDGLRRTRDGDVQRYLCRRCGYRFSGFKQNRVPELQIKEYVTFQPFKKVHSRPDFAQITICHSDSATKKALNDSSLSIGEDVTPHNDPDKSTTGKSINKFLCDSGKRRVCASEREAKNLVEVETRTGKRAACMHVQLEQALFKNTSEEFTVRVANKPQEIKELLEAGFDVVCQKDDLMYFGKRK